MKPNEIRSELLGQHAELRVAIEQARRAVAHSHESESMRGELRACVGRLSLDLRAHNRHEEELLKGILFTVDAWGPVRAAVMDEKHVAEHAELCALFSDASSTSDAALVGGGVVAILDRMLAHMAHEEKTFLGEDVLREDSIVVDQFSG